MSRVIVLVGTRKGCFLLESDGDRRDWSVRGPFCEGWPVYHAVHDPAGHDLRRRRERVARRRRLAQRRPRRDVGALQRGPRVRRDGDLKLSKVSGPAAPRHGRLLAGAEAAGVFESRDGGARGRCCRRSTASPAATTGTTRPSSRPATWACRACSRTPTTRDRFWVVVQGYGIFETDRRRRHVDAAQPRPARRLAARRPGGRLLRAQARDGARPRAPVPAEPLRHAPQRRRRPLVDRDHRGSAERLRLRRRRPPARPRRLLRHPARRRPRPHACPTATRRSGARATPAPAGSGSTAACRSATRTSACCARVSRSTGSTIPGMYFGTSTGQVFASADEGDTLARDRELPAGRRIGRGRGGRLMADAPSARRRCRRCSPACRASSTSRRRPSTRRSSASTSAGPACATACASQVRPCGRTSTCSSIASAPALDTALSPSSRVDVIAAISGG